MGIIFAEVFRSAGFEVTASGRKTSPSNTELAQSSDIVMVSVPISSTIRAIEEIAPLMERRQVLCDLTSIKSAPVEAMMRSKAEVIGFHPMFGPGLRSIRGQNIIATPERCSEETISLFRGIFEREGARVTIMSPHEHDRVMAIVQGLVHFATLSIAETVRTSGIDLETILSVMSPVYRMEMGLVGRILGQSPELYGGMLRMNPDVSPVIESFRNATGNLMNAISAGKADDFNAFFERNRKAFEDYIPHATRDTDKLIEMMVSEP